MTAGHSPNKQSFAVHNKQSWDLLMDRIREGGCIAPMLIVVPIKRK